MAIREAGLAVSVALGALLPLGVGAAVALSVASHSPLESADKRAPLVDVIQTAQRSGQVNVSIKVQYAYALTPTTQASGTVTALHVAAGDRIDTGTRVMDVNAQVVTAYASDSPLYRDVSRGLAGTDVATAQAFLTACGYDTGGTDGNAGPGTVRAIKAFNQANGYGKDNPVLSLTSLLWIGATPVTVDTVSVHPGDQVAPGTALFTTSAALAAITVAEPPGAVAAGDLELVVGDVVTPYVAGSSIVTDADAVVAIVGALGTATDGLGTLRLVTPTTVATVPSSAVVTDASGRTCLFESETSPPTVVTPTGGSLGAIDLDVSFAGKPVLLNPRDVRTDLSCGS